MRLSAILLLLLLGGCATTKRQTDAETRGYERGYAQAVKEQYWILQSEQRTATPAPNSTHP